jgi:prepilin-type N-terminal cleavage/methylation domain-containing protein
MSRLFFVRARRGLTLIELVVVVAILGVLAAMLLPKFEGLQNAADHAAAASSVADTAKLIETYKSSKMVYPDGWDSLTDGAAMWTSGNVGTKTKGLDDELAGKLTVMTTALTAAQVSAFQSVGINTILNVTTTSTDRPGDMFTTPVLLSTSTKLVVVNNSNSDGMKIIDHVYRQNKLAGATSGTLPANTQLVVFGLGPQNALLTGNSMMEAPTYGHVNAQYIYNRLLVVFELTASKVTFKAVLGADGDLLDDMSVKMQTANL